MRGYHVIYERAVDVGWGAYTPDLSGLCVIDDNLEVFEKLFRQDVAIHIRPPCCR
jgi:hypothetical protein